MPTNTILDQNIGMKATKISTLQSYESHSILLLLISRVGILDVVELRKSSKNHGEAYEIKSGEWRLSPVYSYHNSNWSASTWKPLSAHPFQNETLRE